MAYLTLSKINKIYPNGYHAVHNFDLEIEKGEFIVFVGPSGCPFVRQPSGKPVMLRNATQYAVSFRMSYLRSMNGFFIASPSCKSTS